MHECTYYGATSGHRGKKQRKKKNKGRVKEGYMIACFLLSRLSQSHVGQNKSVFSER